MRKNWHEIKNDENIKMLLEKFTFQECCVKEMHYDSGAYVDGRRRMQGVNKKRKLSMLLQSSDKDCRAIEMVFEGIDCMKLQPANMDYSAEIHGVYMGFEEGQVVWIDSDDYTESYTELYDFVDVTWIKAQKLKWREVKLRNGKKSWYIKHEQDKKYLHWGLFNTFSFVLAYAIGLFLLCLFFPNEFINVTMQDEFKYAIVILVMLISPLSSIGGIVKGIKNRQEDRFGIKCAILSMLGIIFFVGTFMWIISVTAIF